METTLAGSKLVAFVRAILPVIRNVRSDLPTMPGYRVEAGRKPGSVRFVEEKRPNWWQLGKQVREELKQRPEGSAVVGMIQSTRPFREALGKRITDPFGGSVYASAEDIASEIVISYLLAADTARWKASVFEQVWSDCTRYFDATVKQASYCDYAPIYGWGGRTRRVQLGGGREIRKLRPSEMARLASINHALAGYPVLHQFPQWSTRVIKIEYKLPRAVEDVDAPPSLSFSLIVPRNRFAEVNDEVAVLRCLLTQEIAAPICATIRTGHPRDPRGGFEEMPWRPRLPLLPSAVSPDQVSRYARRRRRFLALRSQKGWTTVAASMRRFAIAWENPFPADALTDIVAALEALVVREPGEVSYKVRIRTSHLIAQNDPERRAILCDLRDAYKYRSAVAHGSFVFDDARQWELAKRLKTKLVKKPKEKNPFHDVNEIHRLKYKVAEYYRRVLGLLIDRGKMDIDWAGKGL